MAKLELDLDNLWDDDRVLLEEDQWGSDEIPESDDSNAEVSASLFGFLYSCTHTKKYTHICISRLHPE